MARPDLNLLLALDALLDEGSVIGAARRMNLSPPAMSRTLSRIREALADPVFVQVGRKLMPTPRALALREQVRLAAQLHGLEHSIALPLLTQLHHLRTLDLTGAQVIGLRCFLSPQLPHRLPFQFQWVCPMYDPIQDSVCNRRIAKQVVPRAGRVLAGQD